jgi:glycosyltransferase involved in cell wall biosynthesis
MLSTSEYRPTEKTALATSGANSLESPAGVSVIICCYNSAARLAATLHHLSCQQTDASLCWEVIVVDNNSSDETANVARSAWPPAHPVNLRVVTEEHPGLSNARARGLNEAKFEFVSFIDDDNWVSPDWVQTVADIFSSLPSVGVCGSRNAAICETEPPEWFSSFHHGYAVGEIAPATGFVPAGKLWGAGLCIRRQIWRSLDDAGFRSILRGRMGTAITSGEDTELCLAASLAGWGAWYDSRLQLKHCIPATRLRWSYARKLSYSFGVAGVALRLYQIAAESEPVSRRARFRATWLWHFQGALRNLARSNWICLARGRNRVGDVEVLHRDRALGTVLALIPGPLNFRKQRTRVRALASSLSATSSHRADGPGELNPGGNTHSALSRNT